MVQKRFKFPDGSVELYAEKVNNRGLCAIAQAESLRYKLLGGLAVRRCAPVPALEHLYAPFGIDPHGNAVFARAQTNNEAEITRCRPSTWHPTCQRADKAE